MLSFVSVAATVAALASVPFVSAIDGDATMTGASLGGGTCSFANYTFPAGIYGAGLGPSNWANGTKCGSCLQVDGPRGSVKVMVRVSQLPQRYVLSRTILSLYTNFIALKIVDSCPSCTNNRLNLYEDAFLQVGDKNNGIIPVRYNPVACGINQPLTVRNKEGTSKWL
jgi:expansin